MYRPLLLIACVFWLVACGSGGGDTPADNTRVTFADNGALDAQKAQIEALVDEVFVLAADSLAINDVTVLVTTEASRTIPGWSIGGYALGPDRIELVIDPQAADLDVLLAERLPHIIAHELHHTVRLIDPGIYVTLGEALVFEAMADHYALGLIGDPPPPWTSAFPASDTPVYLERALPLLDQPFNFEAWFFGVGTDLPQWTGYTLGFRILRDYYERNPAQTPATTVNAPTEQFFEPNTL